MDPRVTSYLNRLYTPTLEDAKELAAQFTLLHLGKFIEYLNNIV